MPFAFDNTDYKSEGAWLTIGSFDGVHIGHQKIIRTMVEKARATNSPSIVLTFFPHPAKVLRKIEGPFYLSTPEEKDNFIKQLGVSSLLTLNFSEELSQLKADDFMRLLQKQLHFSYLLVGNDFHLGKDREGDYKRLVEIGRDLKYQVEAIQPLKDRKIAVSSSLIRELLSTGNLEQANQLLARWYELDGMVVHGDGRGKHIGIPTANVYPWAEKLLPAPGIYAAWSKLNERFIPGVVNIGFRPTFYNHPAQQTIEVHLLNFNADIYGTKMRLFFVERIRDEIKFDSAEALMREIRNDIEKAREALDYAPTEKNLSA